MKYMLLTYLDEQAWANLGEAEQKKIMSECSPQVERLIAEGKFLGGAPLHPSSMATTVRVRAGKRNVIDGPFAETKEQLGGYALIDARDLDDAIAIASGFLDQRSLSTIEIRPVVEMEKVPSH